MRTRLAIAAIAVMVLSLPAAAQDESALKTYFEGKRVVLKIDMPGTSDGVDVQADAARAIDYRRYGERLKQYGAAIHSGEAATVTLVKVKSDLIEFQLGGGGFGTFGDDTSTSVYMPHVEKSSREKELEKRIDDETDRRRRRDLERELDELRDRRERENRRIDAERERAEEIKRARLADRRLRGGSRFNIRYDDEVPRGIRPEEVMAALAQYVDFEAYGVAPHATAAPDAPLPPPSAPSALRKGMLREDVERLFGSAVTRSERREGTLVTTTLVFVSGDERITADFIDDVLVRYTISSK